MINCEFRRDPEVSLKVYACGLKITDFVTLNIGEVAVGEAHTAHHDHYGRDCFLVCASIGECGTVELSCKVVQD